MSEDKLPDLQTLLRQSKTAEPNLLRRSPRKATAPTAQQHGLQLNTHITFSATSNQRRASPVKASPSKTLLSKAKPQPGTEGSIFDDAPILRRKPLSTISNGAVHGSQKTKPVKAAEECTEADSLPFSLSKLGISDKASEDRSLGLNTRKKKQREHRGVAQHTATYATKATPRTCRSERHKETQRPNRFILDEARCDEDLLDSDGQEQDEDADTDLSGFIVDDDAEISYQESSEEVDSEEECRERRQIEEQKPRRRLQSGRRRVDDSEDEVDKSDAVIYALEKLRIDEKETERSNNRQIEVVDLISPEHKSIQTKDPQHDFPGNLVSEGTNLFEKFRLLKLSPTEGTRSLEVPSKPQAVMWSSSVKDEDNDDEHVQKRDQFATPPQTPPQSPTKLKSPSKLLSPSKRGDGVARSPHRQSMDAFWDLNEVNEWNDNFSPKKAPIVSPRKNRFAALDLWSDAEDDSSEAMNETSDSLPSPCASPSKPRSRSASPIKAEKQRLATERKAKQAAKKDFEENRDKMAQELLAALDKNVTGSRISNLAASTGGVQIIWSKTLRSTAGRANWRRTVTKPSGSPAKGKSEESAPGTTIQHFANIELAIKVIDRQDRLINTLAHEFCHLTNFMISGVRDQPHGASFQSWARKVVAWMKSQDEVPEWKFVEVTTKHRYVIEWKYLWICTGREQNKAMQFLNIDEEDGCGAKYGRHSKSIDTDKHRCGRCKGRLIQVRPKPRASPVKKTERKEPVRSQKIGKDVGNLEKLVEIVEISD